MHWSDTLVISMMVSALALASIAFAHKPRVLAPVTPGRGLVTPASRPPTARSPPIRAAVNDTLTVGDTLLGALNRQMDQLPDTEHLRRAERTLDALVDSGSAELEALKHGLDRDLHRAGHNTSLKLEAGLRRTGAIYETAFSHAEAALDAALVPTRDALRADLQLHREEEAARREVLPSLVTVLAELVVAQRSLVWGAPVSGQFSIYLYIYLSIYLSIYPSI